MLKTFRNADYLTVIEAARELGVSRQSVHDYLRAGRITAVVFGRTYYIHRRDVAALAEERRARYTPQSHTDKQA